MPLTLPKISIVTPSYNQGKFLEETIKSVVSQGYPKLEYIIIDGGSTDGSIEIIKKYETFLSYWASENDQGQTYAITKGMALTTGDLVNWLNSDDILLPGSLMALAQAYLNHGVEKAIFCGNSKVIDSTGTLISEHIVNRFSNENKPLPNAPDLQQGCQASVFYSKEAWNSVNGIDLSLNYAMDIDLAFRSYEEKIPFIAVDHFLAAYRKHDDTKTHAGWKESTKFKKEFYFKQLDKLSTEDRKIYEPRVQRMMFGFYVGSIWPSDPFLTRLQKAFFAAKSFPKSLTQPYQVKRILLDLFTPGVSQKNRCI